MYHSEVSDVLLMGIMVARMLRAVTCSNAQGNMCDGVTPGRLQGEGQEEAEAH